MMTDAALQLKPALANLPEGDRAALAAFLIQTLDTEIDHDAEEAWAAELDRREQRIRAGLATGEPAEKVFAELREKHS